MTPTRLFLIASLCAGATAHAGDFVNPGKWEQVTLLSPDGVNWRPGTRTQGCLTQQQADDWVSQVKRQIATAGCTSRSLSVGNGKINGVIACPSVNQPVVKVTGQYSNSDYSADLVSEGVVDASAIGGPSQMPVKVYSRWSGRLLGPC